MIYIFLAIHDLLPYYHFYIYFNSIVTILIGGITASTTPFFIDAPVKAAGLIKSGFSNVLKSLNLAEVIISALVMPFATMLA